MKQMNDQERKQFLSIRKEAGKTIDPETAEVRWTYIPVMDPYGIYPDDPEEYKQVGRGYFARSPGSDIWVSFYDLPESTSDALWEKHRRTLAFPAGFEEAVFTLRKEIAEELGFDAPEC